jgi:hypothetical protein
LVAFYMLSRLTPMPLRRTADPFDHPDWVFELKYDGFRALAVLEYANTNSGGFWEQEFRRFFARMILRRQA